MNRLFYVLSFIILFANCQKKEAIKPYVISYQDMLAGKRMEIDKIPPRPITFYGNHHLILDKNGAIYYYQKYSPWTCNVSANDSIPDFLGLDPIRLIKIPESAVKEFILENLSSESRNSRVLIIGSQSDTIKNPRFLTFIQSLEIKTFLRI